MITGIIIALPDEINSLTHLKINKGDCVFINENTLVSCSGAGPENAAKASQNLINLGAERLISWGCAAALSADLKPGDLVLAEQLHAENGNVFSIQSSWLNYSKEQLLPLGIHSGLLAESSTIIAKSSEKQSINTQTTAIALDMESIAIAKTAQQHNFDTLVIRCIADPVSMSLPRAVSNALNTEGDVVLSKLLWFLATHPSELPGLIKLGLHFNAAKNKLKLVAKQLDTIINFEPRVSSK